MSQWLLDHWRCICNKQHDWVLFQVSQTPYPRGRAENVPSTRGPSRMPPAIYILRGRYFGPFTIKENRKELKRYGVLFTCMASRAIQLETTTSTETDSFLNALRCFLSRRGPIRQICCDQGTNFVGARRELKEALAETDHNHI